MRLVKFFLGNWKFTRNIQQPSHHNFKVCGTIKFSICNQEEKITTLLYDENGVIEDENNKSLHGIHVTRQYHYDFINDEILVYHFDGTNKKRGNLFHKLELQQVENCTILISKPIEHLCNKDLYKGKYELDIHNGRMNIEWIVKGPQKDYISKTTLMKFSN